MFGDILPTITATGCNIPCPGNASQICGGANGAYSLFEVQDYYYHAVQSATYSATVASTDLLGSATLSTNGVLLLNEAAQWSAVKIASPQSGTTTFSAVFHVTTNTTTSTAGYGFSLNYGPASEYSSTPGFDGPFLSGGIGLSLQVKYVNPPEFSVVLGGVVLATSSGAVPFSQLVSGVPMRIGMQVATTSSGDARVYVTVNKDWYTVSNVSLGAGYAPDSSWSFRLIASSTTQPQVMKLHNMKIWNGPAIGLPTQVAGSYTYQGCYHAQNFNPLSVLVEKEPVMTIAECHERALRGLFNYFGLNAGNLCYLGRGVPSRPSIMCTAACLYDGSQVCGGWTSYSVYKVDDIDLPANKISYMLSKFPDSALPISGYLGDAFPTTDTATLTNGTNSSGALEFPGIVPASTCLTSIFHMKISTPTPVPNPAVGFSWNYAPASSLGDASTNQYQDGVGSGLSVSFSYVTSWIASLKFGGVEIATAALDPTLLITRDQVRSFVLIDVTSNNETGFSFITVTVGNDQTEQIVFDNVTLPVSYSPLDDWKFQVGATSTDKKFAPEVQDFLAYSDYCGRSNGTGFNDPHIMTFDGRKMTVPLTGDFILAHSPSLGLQVHGRFAMLHSNAGASYIHGVSIQCSADAAVVDVDWNEVIVSDNAKDVPAIENSRLEVRVACLSSPVEVLVHRRGWHHIQFLNVVVKAPSSASSDIMGLYGTPNGISDDDWLMRDGKVFESPRMKDIHGLAVHDLDDLQREWRVRPNEAIFQRPFPTDDGMVTINVLRGMAELTPAHKEVLQHRGRVLCLGMGVAPDMIHMCVIDYISSGGLREAAQSFADSVAAMRRV
eukprot:CAMPEP_0196656658 /NCGR_PEP_ID=MMETSP1086-20130531/19232_1 /TAXON_ID=77921 /ORGANISM="Cyanoptyche  gloeocystis , Strain SAG4.97" /LENGTH=835 /DNA_ID=CAMNT_0041989501 /DNA_START=340 /DNA_END=2847 /DNA_ORIENTATION=-